MGGGPYTRVILFYLLVHKSKLDDPAIRMHLYFLGFRQRSLPKVPKVIYKKPSKVSSMRFEISLAGVGGKPRCFRAQFDPS